MNNEKIVVFTYDFPHRKSLTGMQIIKNSKFQNIYIVSQPWIELKFRKSKNRKEVFLERSPKSNKDYFLVPRVVE